MNEMQKIVTTISVLAVRASFAPAAIAQPPVTIARDGWEAYPEVEYQGGDATKPKRLIGILVLTESTIALHWCRWQYCEDDRKAEKTPFLPEPLYLIPLCRIQDISASSQVHGPSATSRIDFGLLAGDQKQEFVGMVYESDTTAEAPVFRTLKAQFGAIEAKVRFRLEKLGVELKP
jgi:hypothetical protein